MADSPQDEVCQDLFRFSYESARSVAIQSNCNCFLYAVPSTTINPALGAYGHIFNDDAWQTTGQSLHWRTDHGMPDVSRRKQICTPKVATVPGPYSSDLRSTYKPSFITKDGNHTSKAKSVGWMHTIVQLMTCNCAQLSRLLLQVMRLADSPKDEVG